MKKEKETGKKLLSIAVAFKRSESETCHHAKKKKKPADMDEDPGWQPAKSNPPKR